MLEALEKVENHIELLTNVGAPLGRRGELAPLRPALVEQQLLLQPLARLGLNLRAKRKPQRRSLLNR